MRLRGVDREGSWRSKGLGFCGVREREMQETGQVVLPSKSREVQHPPASPARANSRFGHHHVPRFYRYISKLTLKTLISHHYRYLPPIFDIACLHRLPEAAHDAGGFMSADIRLMAGEQDSHGLKSETRRCMFYPFWNCHPSLVGFSENITKIIRFYAISLGPGCAECATPRTYCTTDPESVLQKGASNKSKVEMSSVVQIDWRCPNAFLFQEKLRSFFSSTMPIGIYFPRTPPLSLLFLFVHEQDAVNK
ncbi:hypothetical protein MPH_07191, partial [Macrophomina phaseolina MS6]